MNILEALADPKLFAQTFKRRRLRGDTWAAWRVFLAALFGLPLDDEGRELFEHHTGRTDAPQAQSRECFVIAGRRSGKSLIAALVAVFLACFKDYSDVLAPGETGTVMILSSDRRQARVIFNYVLALLEVPLLKSMVVSPPLKESVTLSNRITIEIHTSSFRAVRGYTIVAAICDEVAFWPAEDTANPDTETLAALRPAMATVPGALLLGISSPYAKRGELWRAYREHYGKPSDVLVWKAASREMNPTLSSAVVAAAYLRDRASASAEFGGEFRDDVEGFISVEVVESRIVSGTFELPPVSGRNYVAFCDPSGGRSDSMALAIAHESEGRAILDLVREIQAPFSPEDACSEFADVLRRYGLSEVEGDHYGGEWPREQFGKRGVNYRVADKTRSELYLALLPALMSGQVQLLDNQRLVNQLVGLERRTARSGKDSVDHSPGAHDDVANAVAGVLVRALGGSKLEWFIAQAAWATKPVAVLPQAPHPTAKQIHELAMEQAGMPVKRPSRRMVTEHEQPGSTVCSECGSGCLSRSRAGSRCNACGNVMPLPDRAVNLK